MHIPRLVTRACQTASTATVSQPKPTQTITATLSSSTTTRTSVSTTKTSTPKPTPTPNAGLDYSIPSAWPNATFDKDYNYINHIAQEAIDNLRKDWWKDAGKLDFGWGTGTTLGALPYKDMVASTKNNRDFVKKALNAAKKHNKNFDPYSYNDDAMWWGTTAFYAYRAYGDKEFLQYSKDVWNWVRKSQITDAEAKAGKSSVRPTKFSSKCNDKSIAGAVFWRSESSDRKDMSVNVITTSLFQTLSAYLAEESGEKKYVDAAKKAYTFITMVLFKKSPNIPMDGMNTVTCKQNNWIFSYNTGKFVEGAVILSKVTKDDKYKKQALKTIVDAVTKVKNWQDKEGHITEGQDGDPTKGGDGRQFKSIYVRSLTEVARREYKNSGLRKLLKRYININYKTVLDKGTNHKGYYGVVWKGPFKKAQSGQMNALDLLTAGIEFNWKR
ncbi:hypothetical protein AURDEDRAFT_175483 [Auricularia subglabra TFB-10046 SS5]|uniref:Six-hairpin glycosidase n=1 Tax=Auricularia subglabra (strain TFB-10046 / SS5) TaxID=717982 RepID=J0CXH9_AURST|nr:hypothetical protein AURDEDRAFT_175483 [Auricularia subglabra TFB-10046 SS5]